ncbi:protein TSSC4 [Copidosoma floridanum]|uniref:protein TSSC4 n=1 Tax=Copidosoma floridanum TaxID=29053 RepID=UPI0006C99B69|nr:protein TSSC4 [Copidosoma floridanum]
MGSENNSTDALVENFIGRSKKLSAHLNAIEKTLNKHKNHTDSKVPRLEDLSSCSQFRSKIKGYRGKQSIFKRPEGPAPRTKISAIPDYRKNPEKWTCYNLDDVSEMSNESNSQAALAFLKELKQRKEKKVRKLRVIKGKHDTMEIDIQTEDNNVEGDGSNAVISFRKPMKKKEPSNTSKPEFRSSKIVMPEYVVGLKKAPKKKNLPKAEAEKIDKSKEIKLDHLKFDDGEE